MSSFATTGNHSTDQTLTGYQTGLVTQTCVINRFAPDCAVDISNGVDLIDLTACGFATGDCVSDIAPLLSGVGLNSVLLDLTGIGGNGTVPIDGLTLAGADVSDFELAHHAVSSQLRDGLTTPGQHENPKRQLDVASQMAAN